MKIQATLSQLESLVAQIEDQDIDLDEAVKNYGESIKLAQKLLDELTKAKTKITKLNHQADAMISSEIQ